MSVQNFWDFFFFLIRIIYFHFIFLLLYFSSVLNLTRTSYADFQVTLSCLKVENKVGNKWRQGCYFFIPSNGSQPSVPPARRRLINNGHLHVLHENIGPSTGFYTSAAESRLSQWKDYRRASGEKCFQCVWKTLSVVLLADGGEGRQWSGGDLVVSCLFVQLLVVCRRDAGLKQLMSNDADELALTPASSY